MAKPNHLKIGYGYHHVQTGNWYVFLGIDLDGDFVFYRAFNNEIFTVSKPKAYRFFNPTEERAVKDADDYSEGVRCYGKSLGKPEE